MCVVFSLWNSMTFAKVTQDCELVINGRCTDCNSLAGFEINTDETCKALCPNRKVFYPWRQKYCALEECPQEYPVRDEEYGHCSKEKIEQQDMYKQEFKEIDATDKKYAVGTKTGKCPSDKPLTDVKGICFSCDIEIPIETVKDSDCEKYCPSKRKSLNNYCVKLGNNTK